MLGVPVLPLAIAQMDGRTQVATLDAGGLQRHFRVYRPNRISRSPGLVIVLHGSQSNGLQAEAGTGFDAQAHRLGWIAVYPDGYRDGWDAQGCCHHPGVDDVAFISALIDEIESTDRVDRNRVYVTGISRGGMMSYRLGCELASQIAAIAPVAGNMAAPNGNARDAHCMPLQPVSLLAIQSTADSYVPFQGGLSVHGLSVHSSLSYAPFTDVIYGMEVRRSAVDGKWALTTDEHHGHVGEPVAVGLNHVAARRRRSGPAEAAARLRRK